MTDTETTPLIDEEVVDRDRELARSAKYARDDAAEARRHSGETIAALNQFRWEMTECPLGPSYSQEAYAQAVGQKQQTISKGVVAWRTVLDASDSTTEASDRCAYHERH